MINSEPEVLPAGATHEDRVDAIVQAGSRGAVMLAGITTAIVVALWLAFYFLVFLPRGPVL